jgi:hypothetical protein
MTVTLTPSELQTLEAMEALARSKLIPYWQIYQWLADTLTGKGVASQDSVLLWLKGATEANAGRKRSNLSLLGWATRC